MRLKNQPSQASTKVEEQDHATIDSASSDGENSSEGSSYTTKRRGEKKRFLKKRVKRSVRVLQPVMYDRSRSSLTDLPYEVLLDHLLRWLDAGSIFNLFLTCKLFLSMIGYPSLKSHRRWNLYNSFLPPLYSLSFGKNVPLYSFLLLGGDDHWIQALSFFYSGESRGYLVKFKDVDRLMQARHNLGKKQTLYDIEELRKAIRKSQGRRSVIVRKA
jgi:hypothetical protein